MKKKEGRGGGGGEEEREKKKPREWSDQKERKERKREIISLTKFLFPPAALYTCMYVCAYTHFSHTHTHTHTHTHIYIYIFALVLFALLLTRSINRGNFPSVERRVAYLKSGSKK